MGPFSVERDGAALAPPEIGSRKARTLLKLITVERGHVVPADRLAEAVWGTDLTPKWERDLATLVSRLRAVFGADAIAGSRTGYRFAGGPTIEVDLDDADRLTSEAESRLRSGEPALAHAAAARALEILGAGVLLEDEPYAEWAEGARADASRLLRRARRAGWQAALAVSDLATAARHAEAAISADPLDEEAHRALMRAHLAEARPGEALAAYERLREILSSELGADPAAETRALHLSILREETAAPDDEAAPASAPSEPADPRFVGREAELAQLSERWSNAAAAHPSMVLIAGEAGIGKTRLAAEVVDLAVSTGGTVLQARCYEAERSMFLQPVLDSIRSFVLSAKPDLVRELVGDRAGSLAELVPEIGQILRPLRYERATPDIERRRAFEALTGFLRALAARGPVLLFLDDLHNAGSSTLELLHFLTRRTAGARLLVLATLRVDEGGEALSHLDGVAARLDVGPLRGPAVSELARRMGAGELAERIESMTRGHTLFVVEMLRSIAERQPEEGDAPIIPDTLLKAVVGRVRRTGPDVEELLRVAATLGSAFDLEVAARLLDVPFEEAARRADRARVARLLVDAGPAFEFANDLIRDILYMDTPLPTRSARHRRAARLLEGNPEAVAIHAAAADDWAVAFQAWMQAADRAAARYANRDAEQMLERAMEAAARLGDPAQVAQARLARGRVREALAEFSPAYDDHLAAIELAREAGDAPTEMQALRELGGDILVGLGRKVQDCLPNLESALRIAEDLEDQGAQVDILARLAVIWSNRLRFDIAYEDAERAVEVATELSDDRAMARALDGLKAAAAYCGDLDTLESVLPRLERILRSRGELWLLHWSVFESSFIPMARAQWDRAAKRIEEAIELTRRIGYRTADPMYVAHLGWIHRSRGRYGSALSEGERAVGLAEDIGHPWMIAFTEAMLGWTLTEVGAFDEAVRHLEHGMEAAERDGAEGYVLRCLAHLALALWERGDHEEATAFLERSEEILQSVVSPGTGAFLHGAHAYVAAATVRLAAGDPEGAEELVAPVMGADWLDAAAASVLVAARCRTARGDRDAAAGLASRALRAADEAGLPAVAWQARAILAQIAGAGEAANENLAAARRIVDSLAASIPDDAIRKGYAEATRRRLEGTVR